MIEHRPTDVIPTALILDHQLADRIGKLLALPIAFQATFEIGVARSASTNCLDGVGGRSEVVLGDVSDTCRLTSGERGVARRTSQRRCRSHGVTACRTRFHHAGRPLCPSSNRFDRFTRPRVRRALGLEEVQDVLGTRRGPQAEAVVVGVGQSSPSADRDQARVAMLRQDHNPRIGRLEPGPTSILDRRIAVPKFAHDEAGRGLPTPGAM